MKNSWDNNIKNKGHDIKMIRHWRLFSMFCCLLNKLEYLIYHLEKIKNKNRNTFLNTSWFSQVTIYKTTEIKSSKWNVYLTCNLPYRVAYLTTRFISFRYDLIYWKASILKHKKNEVSLTWALTRKYFNIHIVSYGLVKS